MDRRLIRSVLVPNRGEIAVRIARACREMGIRSVLACSDDARTSWPARFFDDIESLGSGDARQTYLNVDRILEAARAANADAIHPGYGFLSERPALAAACESAKLIFIGPRAETIQAMGSKSESRRLMAAAGVPIIPGYDGNDQGDQTLSVEAERIGFPLMIKPSGGGGGKGMKVVRRTAELQSALESARREAAAAFGDDTLLLERFIEEPRHIEFQIFGDEDGEVVHLYERDCSTQRRHQKVIEESPAPRFETALREKMARAAVAAARAVRYRGAGTVEFIVTPAEDFYFLEMNTRIQVEHPVTEVVLGVDLVRAQLSVAMGDHLPWRQKDLRQSGHAVECRIYAEDADDGFLPQTGTIRSWTEPSGPGVRVDSGVGEGTEIQVKYDPLMAKVIVHAESRESCLQRLDRALAEFAILGTTTNVSYLRRVINHDLFRQGRVTTSFLLEHAEELKPEVSSAAGVAAILSGVVRAAGKSPRPNQSALAIWERIGPWGR